MKLRDLSPRLTPPGGTYQELTFRCPKCQQHEIGFAIWPGPAGDVRVPINGLPADWPGEREGVKRLWHAEQGPDMDWDSLSITPSIDQSPCGDPCGGWHGFITKGEVS